MVHASQASSPYVEVPYHPYCARAQFFRGRHVTPCGHHPEVDPQYPVRQIRFVDSNGTVHFHGAYEPIMQTSFRASRWSAVSPEDHPKQFLLNQCAALSTSDEQNRCAREVKQLFSLFRKCAGTKLSFQSEPFTEFNTKCATLPNSEERKTCHEINDSLQALMGHLRVTTQHSELPLPFFDLHTGP